MNRLTRSGIHLASILLAICQLTRIAFSDSGRAAINAADLNYWLANMKVHGFDAREVGAALGVSVQEAEILIKKSESQSGLPNQATGDIAVLPYPGGRHPRIGFLEGAINPQRETKVSVFAPWKDGGYLVVDFPEAVWHQSDGQRQLLYLAHTHVETIWDKSGTKLTTMEWDRTKPKALSLTRKFPNRVEMTSIVKPVSGGVRLQFSITNNSEAELTGLQIQMCGMLKGLKGFENQTNDNKIFSKPFSVARSETGKQWVIFSFDHCHRAWGNAKCPCLHSDPQVPDCKPGETQTVHGWVSFFEGEEIAGELKRLEKIAFEPLNSK